MAIKKTKSIKRTFDNPVIEIKAFFMSNMENDYTHYESQTFINKNGAPRSIPNPFPFPNPIIIPDQGHKVIAGTSRPIRWVSDNPFIMIPEDYNCWQREFWDRGLFLPPNTEEIWYAAFSKPWKEKKDEPLQHYLELVTTDSVPKNNKTYIACYTLLPMEDTLFNKWQAVFRDETPSVKKVSIRSVKLLAETILSKLSTKSTIIIAR